MTTKNKLNSNEKHQALMDLLSNINNNVNTLHEYCNSQFTQLHVKINEIEHKTLNMQQNQNTHNFTKVANKEEYLNNNIQNVISKELCVYLSEESDNFITFQNIHDIMNETYNIYDFVCNVIYNIVNHNSDTKFLYTFPYQKSTIYYWNFEKQTWEKCDINLLKKIFNTIQYKIIQRYNELIQNLKDENKFHLNSMKFMESCNLLFLDNFDQKSKIFKKTLFDKLSN